jgi:hypothetical protein
MFREAILRNYQLTKQEKSNPEAYCLEDKITQFEISLFSE